MQNLKFRVWSKQLERWITPDEWMINLNGELKFINLQSDDDDTFWTVPDKNSYIIQQFTGLLDKDGKEIFEGDIVNYTYKYQWTEQYEHKGEVKYINGRFINIPYKDEVDGDDFYSTEICNVEIIGNIIENPDYAK